MGYPYGPNEPMPPVPQEELTPQQWQPAQPWPPQQASDQPWRPAPQQQLQPAPQLQWQPAPQLQWQPAPQQQWQAAPPQQQWQPVVPAPQQWQPVGPQPIPPGAARLAVTTRFLPLAFLLFLTGPKVIVDGYERARKWGTASIDVAPGAHRIGISTRYLGNFGPAEMQIQAAPGQTIPIFYSAPAVVFMRGAIGHTPQKTPGLAVAIGLNVMVLLFFAIQIAIALS